MKITAETLSPAHLRHLREECAWRRTPADRCICDDAAAALDGNSAALDRCVTHWHEMFCEDIDALDVREQAALICQVAASNPDVHDEYASIARLMGWRLDDRQCELALDAWMEAYGEPINGPRDAEAEALIRTGFQQKEDR